MTASLRFRSGIAMLGIVLTACVDSTSPTPLPVDAALAKGVGGGGGGGGGGGAPAVGKIRPASAGAVCSAGTSMGISIRKGINDRAEVVMSIVGPGAYPTATPGNSLYWAFTITDDATGARLLAFATSSQYVGTTARITITGSTTTPGVHSFTFLAQNHDIAALTDFASLLASPFVESCTTPITVIAD